ncbi:MAG TPA: hypothetical protein VNU26_00740 [Mycobacteriales bacterium]|nr:hypothetical protein [Mycobacteriales bacterium]
MERSRRARYRDYPDAGPALTALRLVLLVISVALALLCALRREWLLLAFMVVGCGGVVAALRRGKAPTRLPKS